MTEDNNNTLLENTKSVLEQLRKTALDAAGLEFHAVTKDDEVASGGFIKALMATLTGGNMAKGAIGAYVPEDARTVATIDRNLQAITLIESSAYSSQKLRASGDEASDKKATQQMSTVQNTLSSKTETWSQNDKLNAACNAMLDVVKEENIARLSEEGIVPAQLAQFFFAEALQQIENNR